MPSGARMTEHGRPWMCGRSHSATDSKYRARSSFVIGLPRSSCGQRGLSAFEIGTPMTTTPALSPLRHVAADFATLERALADRGLRVADDLRLPRLGWLARVGTSVSS